MTWRSVLDGVDAVEAWIAGESYWIQVPVLLAVLLPLAWSAAGLIDRVIEKTLRPHTRREIRLAAAAAIANTATSKAATSKAATSKAAPAAPAGDTATKGTQPR